MSIRVALFAVALLMPFAAHAQEPAAATAPAPTQHVRISTGVLNQNALHKVPPVYPAGARAAHIEGTVLLHILLDQNGNVEDLQPVSGPPELQPAALDAVRQWTYKPFILNGNPVPVESQVMVNFRLTN